MHTTNSLAMMNVQMSFSDLESLLLMTFIQWQYLLDYSLQVSTRLQHQLETLGLNWFMIEHLHTVEVTTVRSTAMRYTPLGSDLTGGYHPGQ